MNPKSPSRFSYSALFLLFLLPSWSLAAKANFTPAQLPAQGIQQSLLHIQHYGRYSLQASSAQGTALQLVDRMTGPGAIQGLIGKEDGRIDTFLAPGEYKIITHGHEHAQGQVKLEVLAFQEKSGAQAPSLPEFKRVDSQLADLQQRSYWLQITTRRTLAIEAAGRNLADLRLWREGNWLLQARPQKDNAVPVMGQTLQVRRLVAQLNPGLYLLTAYGGPTTAWAEDSPQHPLHLRFGIPLRAETGRDRFKTSPFGVDRWLVSGQAGFFRLDLPKSTKATLRVERFDPKHPFGGKGQIRKINKKSRLPIAEISTARYRNNYHLVTVTQPKNRQFLLQHFNTSRQLQFHASGEYWLGVVSTGYGGDEIDTTALLTQRQKAKRKPREVLHTAAAIPLDKHRRWQGRFNLQGSLSLFLEVQQTAKYQVTAKGPSAGYRIVPFLTHPPKNYQAPSYQASGHPWLLDPGLYELQVKPLEGAEGILSLTLQAVGTTPRNKSKIHTATLGELSLQVSRDYKLYLNKRPGIRSGMVLRPLPVDLSHSLPVDQQASHTLQIPISIPAKGRLFALDDEGEMLSLALDDLPWKKEYQVTPGKHTVHVHNAKNRPIRYSLRFEESRLDPKQALPTLAAQRLRPPNFAQLTQSQFLDLAQQEQRSFTLHLDHPGLYNVSSSGLLQTEGWLRTRTRPELVRRKANGIGRNFLIQHYLDQGDYQLSLTTVGKSAGHLGLHLQSTQLAEGGALLLNQPARRQLSPGQGVRYHFHIDSPGRYHLSVLGPNSQRLIRLEDAQGWPLTNANQVGNITRQLPSGTFSLLVLPSALPGATLTQLTQVLSPQQYTGHGPHALTLGKALSHRWQQPENPDQPQIPDIWHFSLPAPADLRIGLDQDMEALLYPLHGQGDALARSTPARPWQGRLAAGNYRLEMRNLRKNQGILYHLQLDSQQLLAGLTRDFNAPTDVPISVGKAGWVLFDSLAPKDLKADLYDAQGTLLASNDDRPDDWNFQLGHYLKPGFYRLHIDPVGQKTATGSLQMRQPKEKYHRPVEDNAERTLSGTQVQLYPIPAASRKEVLLITTQSSQALGLSLERQQGDAHFRLPATSIGHATHPSLSAHRPWDTLLQKRGRSLLMAYTRQVLRSVNQGKKARVMIPDNYRLRAWPLGNRLDASKLQIHSIAPQQVAEAIFSGPGIVFPASQKEAPTVIAIALERPGTFAIPKNSELLWAAGLNRPFALVTDGLLSAPEKMLWVLATSSYQGTLKGTRVQLGNAENKPLQLALRVKNPAFTTSLGAQAHTRYAPSAILDLHRAQNGPLLAVIHSDDTQPGAAFGPGGLDTLALPGAGQAVAASSAIAVRLNPGPHPAISLWNNLNPRQMTRIQAQGYDYAKPVTTPIDWGSHDLSLAAHTAYHFSLPSESKHLQLTLPPFTAAILQQGDTLLTTHWAGAMPSVSDFEVSADQLWILPTRSQNTAASLTLTPLADSTLPLRSSLPPGKIFQRYFATAGTQYLSFPDHSKVHLRGAITQRSGHNGHHWLDLMQDFYAGKSGLLRVRHNPGWLVVWSDNKENKLFPWSEDERERAITVTPPSQLPLTSTPNILLLQPKQTVLLGIQGNAPMLLQIARKGQDLLPAHLLLPSQAFHTLLPAGDTALALRPLQVDGENSKVSLYTILPKTLGEGLADEIQLAPGAARLYAFTLSQASGIGLGVRASNDLAQTRLFNSEGKLLGEGLLQMHTLPKGRYFVEVQTTGKHPIQMQMALSGLVTPANGPPEKVLRQYLPGLK